MGYPEIKVFDMDDKEKNLAWAKAKYGVAFRRYAAQPGQTVYRLVELREKTGPTALVTQVLDKGGRPINGKDVAFYWPTAPSPPDPPTTLLQWDWHKNFVHGPTNMNGDVGPGMGKGAYHGEGEGGPHAVWVRDSAFPSDICEKLGMLAGTFHDHLDQKFMRVVEGEGEPEPGPTPEPPPQPEPPPPPSPVGWQMATQRKPGAKVIAGNLPMAGVAMIITAPNGYMDLLTSGQKIEHGKGGFEVMAWSPGVYVIGFLGQRFEVEAGKEFVFLTFTYAEGTIPSAKQRILSKPLPQEEAERIFRALQGSYPGVFSLENVG